MTKELLLFAQTLFKDKFSEFESVIHEFETQDPLRFYKTYRKKFVNQIYIEDFEDFKSYDKEIIEIVILLYVGRKLQLLFEVDWSSEEYPGQVKRALSIMLKKQGYDAIKWKNKHIHTDILATNPKRGEFLPLLFKALNEELKTYGFELSFFDCGDDAYYFFVLPIEELAKISELECKEFRILDTSIYDVYIIKQEKSPVKLTVFIKNKFQIPLSEIKSFLEQEKILFATGNLSEVKKHSRELQALGAITCIEERK